MVFCYRTVTLVKSSTIKFHLDERFEEKTIDDRIVESLFSTVEENEEDVDTNQNDDKTTKTVKLVQKQVDKVSLISMKNN